MKPSITSIPPLADPVLKRPHAILFDWDNTLVNTWPTIHRALTQTFETMGHTPWSMEETQEKVHRSMRDAFPAIFGNNWQQAAELYQKNFRSIHLDMLEPLPLAQELLDSLKGSGIYTAVVSNKTNVNLHKELAHIGWEPYFDKVVGALDAVSDKPSAAPVLLALEKSGIAPNNHVWFIGDSITDMECAHNSGCLPILFGTRDLNTPEFKAFPPAHTFTDHAHLRDVLHTLIHNAPSHK